MNKIIETITTEVKEKEIKKEAKLKNYLTIVEAAKLRNITESCLRKRIHKGEIPVIRTGKAGYLIRVDDVEKIKMGKWGGRPKGSKNTKTKVQIEAIERKE